MSRIALGIEYDGSRYHGWQTQNKKLTLQDTLEAALSQIADEPIQTICAGRTDAGVHAIEQIIHFDTSKNRAHTAWIFGANTLLPEDISIKWATEVTDDFNARRSALNRHYRYIIYNHTVPSALFRSHALWHPYLLDDARIEQALPYFLGEQDFSSLRDADCQSKSPIRRIDHLSIKRHQKFLVVDIIANAFLHHMVRNIIGVLLIVGKRKKPPEWIADMLAARTRTAAGITAAACGLYFMHVTYPERFSLPQSTTEKISMLPVGI